MFSTIIVCLFISNGIFVNSSPLRPKRQMLLPFYSLIHANNNSNIKSNEIVKEIVRFDKMAAHYVGLKQNKSSRILLDRISEDIAIDFKSINTAFMTHRSLGDRKINIDSIQGGQFYDAMRVFGSDDDICLGFPSVPSDHFADVTVSIGNKSSVYYLKQINMNLKKSEDGLSSLEVYSVFIRRGVKESQAFEKKEGAFVVHSAWLYNLTTDLDRSIDFNMKYATSEAFYLEKKAFVLENDEPISLPHKTNDNIYVSPISIYCILVIMVVVLCILVLNITMF